MKKPNTQGSLQTNIVIEKEINIMTNNKPGIISIWKIIGLVIAIGALGYRVICTIMYFDSIEENWGRSFPSFWFMLLLNSVAIYMAFTRGWLTMILSIVISSLSALILCFDGIFWIARISDPSGRTMAEMGYFPLEHLLVFIACIFCFIGFFSIKKRDAKRKSASISE